jgi:hypothetical protein
VSEREDEIVALRRELAETKEVANVAVKAAISALAALEEVIIAATMGSGVVNRATHLKSASEHVNKGNQVIGDALEGPTDEA